MKFVLLVFINIIMATIFYLILRLKLEKYTSDYRERRLKREMDEIINDFNETAERNITILDNRIAILKKLLENSGTINYIDISIDDNKKFNTVNIRDNNHISSTSEELENVKNNNESLIIKSNSNIYKEKLKENNPESNIGEFFTSIIAKLRNNISKSYKTVFKFKHNSNELYYKNNHLINFDNNYDIQKEIESKSTTYSDLSKEPIDVIVDNEQQPSNQKLKDNPELTELELENIFSASEDKYLLISELYNKGYPTELISRCSGIPIGEIKLVLDLNSSL